MVEWAISPCWGGVQSVRLVNPQFKLAARPEHKGAPPWARAKTAAGPLDLVESWEARWDPFRDFLARVEVEGAVRARRGDIVAPSVGAFAKIDPSWGVAEATDKTVTLVWPDPARIDSPLYLARSFRAGPAQQPYALGLEVAVWHTGKGSATAEVVFDVTAWQRPDADTGGLLAIFGAPPDLKGAALHLGEETIHLDAHALASAEPAERRRIGVPAWLGVESRYFLLAAAPIDGFAAHNDVQLHAAANGVVVARIALAPATLGAGDAACAPRWLEGTGRPVCTPDARPAHVKTWSWQLYAGPKDLDHLEPFGHQLFRAIDFGWFGAIAIPMLAVLQWGFDVSGSWPVAILVLTLLVKVLLWPITMKSMRSMKAMGKLKPEIDRVRADIEAKAAKLGQKADPNEVNRATFDLYKQHGVNPVGGCLPLLLQMPIYIALYRSINASVSLFNQPLFGWITDMTRKDPYYVLPAVLGVVMFVQQKITPQAGGDPAQQKMMLYFMPALFTVMMLALPSGLTLYILINTLLSIAQTIAMQRGDAPAPAAKT